ncbi:MAG TPA: MerR family transcriptional regulator, partial [Acidimicrobiales bacterium]
KIRFLESQGLVNPERTPSGYRKFYDHDVERLRWVLRQQREHFLPLKVIRDRLAAEGDAALAGPVPADAPLADAPLADDCPPVVGGHHTEDHDAEAVGQHTNGSPAHSEEPALALSGSLQRPPSATHAAATGAPSFDRPPVLRPPAAPAPPAPAAVATAPAAVATAPPPPTGGSAPSASGPGPAASGQAPSSQAPSGQPPTGQAPSGQSPPSQPPGPPGRPQPTPAASPPAQPEPPAAPCVPVAPTPAAPPPPTTPPAAGLTAGLSGASLTAQELASATGLTETVIASLEGFGLIEPMVVAGAQYYDEEALTVAKLVADFAQYGIEPRHLRLYRNAVDREGGLIEQVVTPLLRQRNPEARQRAVDAAVDLSKLGQGLRASLLRRELRRQVGS